MTARSFVASVRVIVPFQERPFCVIVTWCVPESSASCTT